MKRRILRCMLSPSKRMVHFVMPSVFSTNWSRLRGGVAPESKLEWAVQEELKDIFSVFVMQGAGAEEQEKLQAALGLDDAVCADVKEIVDAGKFQLKADVADEALF